MYSPVIPVVLAKNDGDKRPQFAGSMISARSHFVRVPERCYPEDKAKKNQVVLTLEKTKDGNMLYWVPASWKTNFKSKKVPATPKKKKKLPPENKRIYTGLKRLHKGRV